MEFFFLIKIRIVGKRCGRLGHTKNSNYKYEKIIEFGSKMIEKS